MNEPLRKAVEGNEDRFRKEGFRGVGYGRKSPSNSLSEVLGVSRGDLWMEGTYGFSSKKAGDAAENFYYVTEEFYLKQVGDTLDDTEALGALKDGKEIVNEKGEKVTCVSAGSCYKLFIHAPLLQLGDVVEHKNYSQGVGYLLIKGPEKGEMGLVNYAANVACSGSFKADYINKFYRKIGTMEFKPLQ